MKQIPDAAVQAASEIIRTHDTEQWGEDGGTEIYSELVTNMITAALPHLPLGFAVKKLEWEFVGNYGLEYRSKTSLGFYSIHTDEDSCGGRMFCYFHLTEDGDCTKYGEEIYSGYGEYETIKSAAQADFERRVRECIVPLSITKSSGCVFNDLGINKPDEVLDDASIQAKVSEIGNQIHNLGCEHQNNEALSDRLKELRDQLWDISKNCTKPVDVAAVLNSAALIVEGRSTAINSGFIQKLAKKNTHEIASLIAEYDKELGTAIRALSAEPAQGGFDRADWFYRDNDPDDNGDTAYEAIVNHPEYSVHLVHSSFRGDSRYVFRAPMLHHDDDETLHFATEEEAENAANERKSAITLHAAATTPEEMA